jgi:toxin CcdB
VPRFDVCKNPDRRTAQAIPYVVVVQHDLFDDLATRLVIPLGRRKTVRKPLSGLNLEFEVLGERVVLLTTELAGVPRAALGPVVSSLAAHRAAILGAIDFLISGA